VALGVTDRPPVTGAPSLGRAWVSGWARPLAGAEARAAALEFVRVHPTEDLLLLGKGFVLYRMEAAEVRLQDVPGRADQSGKVTVDPAGYAAAEPDPLYPFERELLLDLADHHRGELAALVHRLAPWAGSCGAIVAPLRLDRHGMVVELIDPTGGASVRPRLVRVDFPTPLANPYQLGALLRPTVTDPARTSGAG